MQAGREDITIEFTEDFKGIDFDRGRLRKMVEGVCHQFGLCSAVVSIAILNDESVREVNRRFLKKDEATDVISFDLSDGDEKSFELVINGEKAQREGVERGHGAEGELALYVVHGLLHNLRFDDSDEAGAEKMHRQEDEILRQFDYGIIYDSRANPAKGEK